ncbi:MAG: 2-succinyl-6-hydroxy-2,4-cyclohexadiene-1-carboxylate synthase [Gemmatimonadota bacterium]
MRSAERIPDRRVARADQLPLHVVLSTGQAHQDVGYPLVVLERQPSRKPECGSSEDRVFARRLHVSLRGAGEPLLLLHGFTGSGAAWGERTLRGLAATHRVLAVDLPGHGRSDDCADPRRYAMEEVLADLERVLDAEGIDRAAWVGYSMGGRIALAAAVRRPERVGRLVLESASPGLETEEERAARRRSDAAVAARIEREGIEAFVDYWTDRPLFATQRRLPHDVRAAVRRGRLANRPDALAACLRGLGAGSQPSFWPALPGVRAPTLLLVGSDDAKFREIGERMRDALPETRLTLVPRAGHAIHLEKPTAWLEAVTGFLAR